MSEFVVAQGHFLCLALSCAQGQLVLLSGDVAWGSCAPLKIADSSQQSGEGMPFRFLGFGSAQFAEK